MVKFVIMFFLLIACYLINNIEGSSLLSASSFDKDSDVISEDYPFVVLIAGIIRTNKIKQVNRIGTGVLITESWVLTAAHIFLNIDQKKREILSVWYGEFTQSPFDTNMFTDVFKLFVHPGFQKTHFFSSDMFASINDVALLFISKVYVSECCGRLSSVNRAALLGLPAKYVGIAKSNHNQTEEDANRKLKFGSGLITKCGPPVNEWSQNLLCVIPACKHTRSKLSYSGSCGDPIFVENKVVGIFSLAFYDSSSFVWTAFTPVEMYSDWIHYVINVKNIKGRRTTLRINMTT